LLDLWVLFTDILSSEHHDMPKVRLNPLIERRSFADFTDRSRISASCTLSYVLSYDAIVPHLDERNEHRATESCTPAGNASNPLGEDGVAMEEDGASMGS
jgi:hypothetical protein